MARLPRDSYDSFAGARALDSAAPLRFGGEAEESATDYTIPRPSRFRSLRGPIAFAVLCASLIVVAWVAWTPVLDTVAEGSSTLAEREGDGRTQLTTTVFLVALGTLGFVLAWWRGTHPRRPVHLSGERGRMAVDAIAGQLRASILELDEVRDAEVSVENRGRSRVRVHAWLRVSPEARIDDVLDGVDDAADWLVHHRLGLLLSEPPLADVKYDELDLRTTRASSPSRSRIHPDDEDA